MQLRVRKEASVLINLMYHGSVSSLMPQDSMLGSRTHRSSSYLVPITKEGRANGVANFWLTGLDNGTSKSRFMSYCASEKDSQSDPHNTEFSLLLLHGSGRKAG